MDNSKQAKESSSVDASKGEFKWGPFYISEWPFIIIFIIFLSLFLAPVIQKIKTPDGKMIPTEPPNESNRIVHSTGLSIIAPINWEQIREWGPKRPNLSIAARVTPGKRYISFITIDKCDESDSHEVNSYKKITFQDFPAYEKMKIDRKYAFDDPAISTYELLINRDGVWWFVEFSVADEMTELPKEIRQYINTIQFPKKSETTK